MAHPPTPIYFYVTNNTNGTLIGDYTGYGTVKCCNTCTLCGLDKLIFAAGCQAVQVKIETDLGPLDKQIFTFREGKDPDGAIFKTFNFNDLNNHPNVVLGPPTDCAPSTCPHCPNPTVWYVLTALGVLGWVLLISLCTMRKS
jgi:hypothetical protein